MTGGPLVSAYMSVTTARLIRSARFTSRRSHLMSALLICNGRVMFHSMFEIDSAVRQSRSLISGSGDDVSKQLRVTQC